MSSPTSSPLLLYSGGEVRATDMFPAGAALDYTHMSCGAGHDWGLNLPTEKLEAEPSKLEDEPSSLRALEAEPSSSKTAAWKRRAGG